MDSNHRPSACHAETLAAELQAHRMAKKVFFPGNSVKKQDFRREELPAKRGGSLFAPHECGDNIAELFAGVIA